MIALVALTISFVFVAAQPAGMPLGACWTDPDKPLPMVHGAVPFSSKCGVPWLVDGGACQVMCTTLPHAGETRATSDLICTNGQWNLPTCQIFNYVDAASAVASATPLLVALVTLAAVFLG
eukprot:NODE_2268_length_592_cov_107.699816_g1794_i0.p1 GENE.NODE_2268_length_592_cov_107.699816_g1794_i0~~NODE_2268_length_592_cov_107.699816_g1794_i0.p1  ORF type:complete len:121 (+),score=9.54 NODE_2268_length_592_cov_107.699816_g1794_i0:148-510(+)